MFKYLPEDHNTILQAILAVSDPAWVRVLVEEFIESGSADALLESL